MPLLRCRKALYLFFTEQCGKAVLSLLLYFHRETDVLVDIATNGETVKVKIIPFFHCKGRHQKNCILLHCKTVTHRTIQDRSPYAGLIDHKTFVNIPI